MSDNKHKNIPTLDEVVQPGASEPNETTKKDDNKAKAAPASETKTKRKAAERRNDERRKKQASPPEGKTERRIDNRRSETRRATDQRRSKELDELVEKIMQDLMPDLEQHMFLQLRFELQKYLPQTLSEFKDKDDE